MQTSAGLERASLVQLWNSLHLQLRLPPSTYAIAFAKSPSAEKKSWIQQFGLRWDDKLERDAKFACCAVPASGVAKFSGPEHTKLALRTLARLVADAICFANVFGEHSNDEEKWLKTKILKQSG